MLKYDKSTGELFSELKAGGDVADYLERNSDELTVPLDEYLKNLLAKKNLTKQAVIERSGLNREYAYHIFSGTKKNPSRTKILALAIAMEMNLDETQYFLRYVGQVPLYPRNSWDAVIISAIEQNLTVMQTNDLLHRLGEKNFLA